MGKASPKSPPPARRQSPRRKKNRSYSDSVTTSDSNDASGVVVKDDDNEKAKKTDEVAAAKKSPSPPSSASGASGDAPNDGIDNDSGEKMNKTATKATEASTAAEKSPRSPKSKSTTESSSPQKSPAKKQKLATPSTPPPSTPVSKNSNKQATPSPSSSKKKKKKKALSPSQSSSKKNKGDEEEEGDAMDIDTSTSATNKDFNNKDDDTNKNAQQEKDKKEGLNDDLAAATTNSPFKESKRQKLDTTTTSSTPASDSSSKQQAQPSSSSKKKKTKKNKGEEDTMDVDTETTTTTTKKDSSNNNKKTKRKEKQKEKKEKEVVEKITKPKPTLDVQVHRLRHMNYIPSPVLSMSSCSRNSSSSHGGNLALARQDGSYELYQLSTVLATPETSGYYGSSNQLYPRIYPIANIAGSSKVLAHSLCWVPTNTENESSSIDNDNTETTTASSVTKDRGVHNVCVAGGPDGTIWIVNFQKSQLHSRFNCGGGGVFDLVTCNNDNDDDGIVLPLVATACQDGSVRIFHVNSSHKGIIIDSTPIATIPTTGSPVLSLAWGLKHSQATQSRQGSSDGSVVVETVLFAGVADGTIRKYDLRLQSSSLSSTWKLEKITSALRMTVESRGRQVSTRIWTMQIVNDDNNGITLVTGNSLGQVQFWNTQTGTLQQSFTQTEQKADVLQISVNHAQNKVFATGVDSRVICLERLPPEQNNDNNDNRSSWKWTTSQRPHTHDVKAMAIVKTAIPPRRNQDDKKQLPPYLETLVTGGIDTKLCSYIVGDFKRRRPMIGFPWPSIYTPISAAPEANIVSMQRYDSIDLFRLDDVDTGDEKNRLNNPSLSKDSSASIGTIRIQTQTNIVTSSLSKNGQWLALCNASSLFVFRLELDENNDGGSGMIIPTKVDLPTSIEKLSITAMRFYKNELLFLADSESKIHVFHLETLKESCILSLRGSGSENDNDSSPTLPVDSLQISSNGQYLTAMSRTQKDCIHVFKCTRSSTNSSGALYAPYWTIPGLTGSCPAATTLIHDSNQLAVATPESHVYIFDLTKQKLNSWSETNGFPIEDDDWPTDLTHRRDFPVRLSTNPTDPTQLIMSFSGAFCVINTQERMPANCRTVPEKHIRRKRPRPVYEHDPNRVIPLLDRENFVRNSSVHRPKIKKDDPSFRNCTICLYYNSILYLDFMGPGKMLVVEQPWHRVIATLPEPLQRRIYGVN